MTIETCPFEYGSPEFDAWHLRGSRPTDRDWDAVVGVFRGDVYELASNYSFDDFLADTEQAEKVSALVESEKVKLLAREELASWQASRGELSPLTKISLGDLMNMPPVEWLVDGIFPASSLVMLAGTGGVGKSTLMVDLSVAVLTGGDFLGKPTQRGSVLYVAGEGLHGYGQRFKATAAHRGVDLRDGDELALVSAGVSMDNEKSMERLAADVAANGYSLVVFDTLSSLSSMDSENDNAQAAKVMNLARSVTAASPRTTAIVVHHANRASGTMRGASAFRDNADAVWVAFGTGNEQDKAFSLSSHASKGGKLRDGEARTIAGLSITEAHGAGVLDFDPAAAVTMKLESKSDRERAELEAHADEQPWQPGDIRRILAGVAENEAMNDRQLDGRRQKLAQQGVIEFRRDAGGWFLTPTAE